MDEPTTPKGQRTKARLFEAASALFERKGFERTTMRAIAAEAGVSVGAAYHYFPSKDAFVLSLYEQMQGEISARLPEVCVQSTPEARVMALMEENLRVLKDHRGLLTHLASAAMDPDSAVSPFSPETAGLRERAIASYTFALAPHISEFNPELAAHLPRLIWLTWMALVFFWIRDRSEDQLKTRMLLTRGVPFLFQLFRFTSLPMAGFLRVELLTLMSVMGDEAPPSDE